MVEGDVAVAVVGVMTVKVAVAVDRGTGGVGSDEVREKYADDGKADVFLTKGS